MAHALADAARAPTLRYFRADDVGLQMKNAEASAFDPVTEGDRAAERAMRLVLAKRRPADGIVGEEFPAAPGTSGLTWVLDPIDGTRAYVAGAPTWGVLVAVRDDDGPILGLIDQPFIGERFFGAPGAPGAAWLHGPHGRRDIRTRRLDRLDDAVLFTTFPEIGTASDGRAFAALSRKVRLTRYGLDCYAYGLVAAGHADLVVEAGLHPWDIAAPMAVIRAAGGLVTAWDGGPADNGGRVLAAANPAIHDAALAILREAG